MRLAKVKRIIGWVLGLTLFCQVGACSVLLSTKKFTQEGITLPFIKNSSNECYYLDEFMPTPNSLVTGKSGSLNLRYYTYNFAKYKEWEERPIILSFYSRDDHCWSLFEEYYVAE